MDISYQITPYFDRENIELSYESFYENIEVV